MSGFLDAFLMFAVSLRTVCLAHSSALTAIIDTTWKTWLLITSCGNFVVPSACAGAVKRSVKKAENFFLFRIFFPPVCYRVEELLEISKIHFIAQGRYVPLILLFLFFPSYFSVKTVKVLYFVSNDNYYFSRNCQNN